MQVKVYFLDINFDKLQDQAPDNSLAGYSYFCKEYREKIAEGLSSEETFNHARQKCIEKGYLKGIIEKEEFAVMFRPLVDREESIRDGAREETAEIMYRAAVEKGASDEILKHLALAGGLSAEQVNEICKEVAEEQASCVAR